MPGKVKLMEARLRALREIEKLTRRVHLHRKGKLAPPCGAGARWSSSVITSSRSIRAVTCRTCLKLFTNGKPKL